MNTAPDTTQFFMGLLLYFLQWLPFGFLVKWLTRRWRDELTTEGPERDSLKAAGWWIGVLERWLIVTFVLIGETGAIGFLIAAKSILRFSDKDAHQPRKQSEYILIGTLLSFSLALMSSLLYQKFLELGGPWLRLW
jgi:hypothetical protein